MAHAQHQIELNGKLYDAASGKILSDKPNNTHTKQSVDGFVARKHIPVKDKPVIHRSHPAPAKTSHANAQKSKTLMRSAVKKPAHISRAVHSHKSQPEIAKPELSSPVRLGRAEKIHQSRFISRFGVEHKPVEAKVVPLPVQVPPEPEESLLSHQPAPVEQPAMMATASKSVDFEKALHDATSHKQPKIPKKKLSHRARKRIRASAKITKISAMVASAAILGGFFFYQNLPNLSMRVAAARAGVDAKLPGYRPAGFGVSSRITYSPGQISVKYKSNSDERSFELTQKNTDLNDQTFMRQQIASSQQPYQTLESSGKTIYIYSGSNATWIDNGTLYQIEGNSSLTSDQLLKLASSL